LERTQTYDYRPFGGESVDQVKFRMLSAIHDIAENHDHQYVGIITHGGPIRVLLFYFPNIVRIYHEPQNILKDIANCDVYEWEVHKKDMDDLKALVR
jgi:broad specificity phosphatase PhoE